MEQGGKVAEIYLGFTTSKSSERRFVVRRLPSGGVETFTRHGAYGSTLMDLLVELLEVLEQANPNVLSAFAQADDKRFMASRQERRFISKDRDCLSIGSPVHENRSRQFKGYWLNTLVNRKDAGALARMACEAAGVPSTSISKLKV